MTEQSRTSVVIERIISPSPVSGATMPPNRNGRAPSRAEAMPRCSVTEFSANVMPTGVIMPTQNSIGTRTSSKRTNGHSSHRATDISSPVTNNPTEHHGVADDKRRIFITTLLPTTSPSALPAKQMLYCKGVSPKCCWKMKGEAEM